MDCVELLILLGSVNFELDHKPDEVLSLVLDRSLACAIPHHIYRRVVISEWPVHKILQDPCLSNSVNSIGCSLVSG